MKPFPVVESVIASYYGDKGGGTQYMSSESVEWLIENGYIEEITEKKYRRQALNV